MNTTVRVYCRTCRNCGAAFTGLAQSRFCPGCRAPRCQSCGSPCSRSNRSERPRLLCGPCASSGAASACRALLPCEPTDARPGTPGKVDELAKRYRNGEPLWHPDDAQVDDN